MAKVELRFDQLHLQQDWPTIAHGIKSTRAATALVRKALQSRGARSLSGDAD